MKWHSRDQQPADDSGSECPEVVRLLWLFRISIVCLATSRTCLHSLGFKLLSISRPSGAAHLEVHPNGGNYPFRYICSITPYNTVDTHIHSLALLTESRIPLSSSFLLLYLAYGMGPIQDNSNWATRKPSGISKLSPDSSNWVTFKTRFLFRMASHDLERTLQQKWPTPPIPTYRQQMSPGGPLWTWTKTKLTYLSQRSGSHDEHIACAQLTQVVYNSLLIWIQQPALWPHVEHYCFRVWPQRANGPGGPTLQMMERMGIWDGQHPCSPDDMALSHTQPEWHGICHLWWGLCVNCPHVAPRSYTTHLKMLTDAAISSGHTFTTLDFIAKAIELSDKTPTMSQPWSQTRPERLCTPHIRGMKQTRKGNS